MICSACGGDGLIEYGAYRGDVNTETRECHLCSSVATCGPIEKLAAFGVSAEQAAASLKKLAIVTTIDTERH